MEEHLENIKYQFPMTLMRTLHLNTNLTSQAVHPISHLIVQQVVLYFIANFNYRNFQVLS
jgi:hypothetical protein